MHVLRALVALLVLIGGLLAPGGDMFLAAPAAALSLLLIHWEVVRQAPRVHVVLIAVPMVFGLLALHRLFVEPATAYGQEKLVGLVTLTALSACCASLIRFPAGFTILARLWVVAAIYITLANFVTGEGLRSAAFGANPIWVARAIAVGFVLLVWMLATNRIRPFFGILSAALMVAGIFATGSRGPMLGAAVGALFIVFFSRISGAKKVGTLIAAGLTGLLLLRFPFFQESRIVGLATGEIAGDQTRNLMWAESVRVIKENPHGVGIGNWATVTSLPSKFNYPHNLFLEVIVEQGLIVGCIFSLVVVGVLIGVVRRAGTSQVALGVAAWLAAEIVNVSVSGDLNARTFFFVLFLAFLVAMHPSEPGPRGSTEGLKGAAPEVRRRAGPGVPSTLQSLR